MHQKKQYQRKYSRVHCSTSQTTTRSSTSIKPSSRSKVQRSDWREQTGVKGDVKVKSEIYFSPKKILHRKQISDWMRKAQDQANNEVYLKTVSQLFSGEIPVVNYIPKYTSDHKRTQGDFPKVLG